MISRKNAFHLHADDQQRYIDVINKLNTGKGPTIYTSFVAIHADMKHRMHVEMGGGAIGRQRFLPWHRDFLSHFEHAMRKIDAKAFIPYWDWTSNRAIPAWIENVKTTVDIPATPMAGPTSITVMREPHAANALPTAAQISSLTNATTLSYTRFTSLLESYHNVVHGWVGGTMNDLMVSPADPLFWMHHAQVDRLWSIWQSAPANNDKHPHLTSANAILDPWNPDTVTSVATIDVLGYQYVD